MKRTNLAIMATAMTIVLGLGAQAHAATGTTTATAKTPAAVHHVAVAKIAAADMQVLASDTLVLDQKTLDNLDKMSPTARANFIEKRQKELEALSADKKQALVHDRDTWFARMTSPGQKTFIDRLKKEVELLQTNKATDNTNK